MKNRFISAIFMLIIFIPILLLGDIYYIVFGSILGLISLWEIMRLEKNIPDYMKWLSYFIVLFLILYNYKDMYYGNIYGFLVLGIMFMIYVFSIIINSDVQKYNYKDAIWLFSTVLLIGFLFNNFLRIRLMGLEYVIYCFSISIVTDTFAYLGGKTFGKKKLCPVISPNKTVEGSVCGSICGTIVASCYYVWVIGNGNVWVIILLSFILTILSQFGDLFFSSIKRSYKIKDFSNLIPGHGGILDRLDSVLFVILGFLVYSIVI